MFVEVFGEKFDWFYLVLCWICFDGFEGVNGKFVLGWVMFCGWLCD